MSCTIISNFIDNYLKTMYNQKEQTYKGVIIMKSIITIGREFGSNGHKIGEELAKSLNIPFYDKEILTRASKESGMCEDIFDNNDEKKTGSFLFSLVVDSNYIGFNSGFGSSGELPISQRVFIAQFDAIKHLAEEGPCVIVGRCSDYVLEDNPNVINIFIHSDLETRCKTVMERDNLLEKKAIESVVKHDKERMSYYNYYTNNKWGDASNYHLTIDSGVLGIEGSVAVIKACIEEIEKNRA